MKFQKNTYLFKYYPYNSYSLSVLINKKVWVSKPAILNDPFDIDLDVIPITPQNHKVFFDEEQLKMMEQFPDENARNQMIQAMNDQFHHDFENCGVFCMSANPKNILMWSHYADHHRGFCIRFVRDPNNKLGDIDTTRPVKYKKKYPSPNRYATRGSGNLYDDIFFTKAKGWKCEEEWRILYKKGDREERMPGDISAIIFGLKMLPSQRKAIKNILSDRYEMKYLQTIKVKNKFELKIIDAE